MKRIWFGAALLFVLLVLGTLGSFFTEQTQSAGAEKLRQASEGTEAETQCAGG